MKILVVNFEYPPLGGGGGDVAKELAKQYVLQGNSVKVFTGWFPGLPHRSHEDNIEIIRVLSFRRKKSNTSALEMLFFLLLGVFPYIQLVKRYEPDIVHIHFGVPTGILGWLSKKMFDIPYVITGHLGDIPKAVPEQTDKLFKFLFPLTVPVWHSADRAFGVSPFISELVHSAYPNVRVKTIPNGVDTDLFRPLSEHQTDECITILFVSRLNPQKDLGTLFRALKKIQNEHPLLNWRLRIAGDGPMYAKWKKEGEAGIGAHVTFLGWLDREKISDEMKHADVFVLPSLKEGMPIVCLQAMSTGLPIVATATEGTIEVVKNNINGLLVPVGNSNELADALVNVLSSREMRLRFGRAGREMAVQYFGWSAMAQKYITEFTEILASRVTFFLPRLITYNRGDISSRTGVIEALRKTFPRCRIFMNSIEPHVDRVRYNVETIPLGFCKDLIPHPRAIQALRQSSVVLWAGGVDLQDDTSLIKIPYIFFRFVFFRLFKKKIIIYAQGMGPIVTPWGAWWTRRVCALANVIMVRDSDSKLLLEKVGVYNSFVVSDAALSLIASPPKTGKRILEKIGVNSQRPLIGISIRRWFHHDSDWLPYEYRARCLPKTVKGIPKMEALLKAFASIADILVEKYGADILFIPMYPDQPEWWEDDGLLSDTAKTLMRMNEHAHVYRGDDGPKEFAAMLGNLDFMIGMRLHSTIIATHQRVPSVHACYTKKGRSYFDRMGFPELVFDVEKIVAPEGERAFIDFIEKYFNERNLIKSRLEKVMPSLETAADEASNHLL